MIEAGVRIDARRRSRYSGLDAVDALQEDPRQRRRSARGRVERDRADLLAGDVGDQEHRADLGGGGDPEAGHDLQARDPLVLDRGDQTDVRLARTRACAAQTEGRSRETATPGGGSWSRPQVSGRAFRKSTTENAEQLSAHRAPGSLGPARPRDDRSRDRGELRGHPCSSCSGTRRSSWSSRASRSGAPSPRRSRAGSGPCAGPRCG